MKVRDLIARLQNLDPEADILKSATKHVIPLAGSDLIVETEKP
jgi:hypothetical protein